MHHKIGLSRVIARPLTVDIHPQQSHRTPPTIAKDLNESPLNMQNAIISYISILTLIMPVSIFLAYKFWFCL